MTTPLIEAGKPRRKSMPSTEYLRASFDYDREAGVLIYRDRPMETFASARVYRAWRSRHCGKPCGNIQAKNYVNCYVAGEKYHAHRLIWKWLHDDEPYYIDHINGIRSDNRAENLRAVTSIENAKNNAMRDAGKRPDEWYWADLLAARWGYCSYDDPKAFRGDGE